VHWTTWTSSSSTKSFSCSLWSNNDYRLLSLQFLKCLRVDVVDGKGVLAVEGLMVGVCDRSPSVWLLCALIPKVDMAGCINCFMAVCWARFMAITQVLKTANYTHLQLSLPPRPTFNSLVSSHSPSVRPHRFMANTMPGL